MILESYRDISHIRSGITIEIIFFFFFSTNGCYDMKIRTSKLCRFRYLLRRINTSHYFDSERRFTVSVISIRDDAHFRHFRSEGALFRMFAFCSPRHPVGHVRHAPTFYCYTRSMMRARTREDKKPASCQSSFLPRDKYIFLG